MAGILRNFTEIYKSKENGNHDLGFGTIYTSLATSKMKEIIFYSSASNLMCSIRSVCDDALHP
jgi:hypothetical protein